MRLRRPELPRPRLILVWATDCVGALVLCLCPLRWGGPGGARAYDAGSPRRQCRAQGPPGSRPARTLQRVDVRAQQGRLGRLRTVAPVNEMRYPSGHWRQNRAVSS